MCVLMGESVMRETSIVNHTGRKDYIDTMKFLLILAIYIGHYGEASGRLFPFVSSFHVRTFFFISGFWALNKTEKRISEFIVGSIKSYMIPWGIWVIVNTLYNSILYSFEVKQAMDAFIEYFLSVRGSATVGGMWFVPCFFFVAVIYHALQRILLRLGSKNTFVTAGILLGISFLIRYLMQYVFLLPQNLIFSIHCIPEYLLCYSLGALLYNTYLFAKERKNVWGGKGASYVLMLMSIVYMAVVYFGKINRLWEWVYLMPTNPVYLLPETVSLIMAYLFICTVAKVITTKWTVEIGKGTLILCLSESVLKTTVWLIAQIFGLATNVTNPIQSLLFSMLVLAIGTRTVVPLTQMVSKRIWACVEKIPLQHNK